MPRALIGLWAANGYAFQLIYDLEKKTGIESLICWWFERGQVEYPGLSREISNYLIKELHQVDLDLWKDGEPLEPSLLMHAVYNSRTGLQETYDLSKEKDVYEFWKWWFVYGSLECRLPLKGLPSIAKKVANKLFIDGALLPNELILIYASYSKVLNLEADLSTKYGLSHLVYWWFVSGRKIFSEIDIWLSELIFRSLNCVVIDSYAHPITLMMEIVYLNRPDVEGVFDLSTQSGITEFSNWWDVHGVNELQLDSFEKSSGYHGKPYGLESTASNSFRESSLSIFTALLGLLASDEKPFFLSRIVEEKTSIEYLIRWWFESGQFENTTVRHEVTQLLVDKFHQVEINSVEVRKPLPPSLLMLAIYNSREGLCKAYSLSCDRDLQEFWNWWYSFGSEEYDLPSKGLPSVVSNGEIRFKIEGIELPVELFVIYAAFGDVLGLKVDLKRWEGISQLVYWWLVSGKYIFCEINVELSNKLYRLLSGDLSSGESYDITLLMKVVHSNRPDLKEAFNIEEDNGRSAFLVWWAAHGVEEYQLYQYDKSISKQQLPQLSSEPNTLDKDLLSNSKINIIGYPSGQFGIGEDARLLYSAAKQAGLDVELWQSKRRIPAAQLKKESYKSVSDLPPNGINIYCMPPFDTMALVHDVGVGVFDAKYKIGFWQWELSSFPREAESVFELVDEVWTISEFVASSLRDATKKPVKVIPLPFENQLDAIADRNYFGLPDKSFIYYFAFDGASFISRKNPMGVIEAFQKAFPDKSDDRVCLVIKTMSMNSDSLWRECLRRSMSDFRIKILDEVYSREKLSSLMNSIDCFVSLHRAEGFGRLIAEALIAEKQVIASEYSGNMDYLKPENALLVSGTILELLPGDYHFYKDSKWFDPDLDSAVESFIKAYRARGDLGKAQRSKASRDFKQAYNLNSTGDSIRNNLIEIYKKLFNVS